MNHFKARIIDARLVSVTGNERVATGASSRGDPEVVVGDVPAVLSGEQLEPCPLVKDRGVKRELEKAREAMLLAFDPSCTPAGIQITEARLRQRNDADREDRRIDPRESIGRPVGYQSGWVARLALAPTKLVSQTRRSVDGDAALTCSTARPGRLRRCRPPIRDRTEPRGPVAPRCPGELVVHPRQPG